MGSDTDLPGTLLSDMCSDCIVGIVMNCPEILEENVETWPQDYELK